MRYLLITFYRKANGQIDERVAFSKRLKPADWSNSNVILDFGLRKIEKCVIERQKLEKTFDELADYYRKVYPALITQLETEAPITLKEKEKTGK